MGKASSLVATDSNLIPQLGLQIYSSLTTYARHIQNGAASRRQHGHGLQQKHKQDSRR